MTATAQTITLLRAGFGAEDIAAQTGRCTTAIRAEIAMLRENGIIAGIWPPELPETAPERGEKGPSRSETGQGGRKHKIAL